MERPTYHAMGDHTECFQVDFDPEVVPYDDLLAMVWQVHDPTRSAMKIQYASVVLAADDSQLGQARDSAARLESAVGRRLATRIEPLGEFWVAEEYHQKWYLRHSRAAMRDIRSFYPDDEGLRDSTAAARINAFAGGSGDRAALYAMRADLGLGDAAIAELGGAL